MLAVLASGKMQGGNRRPHCMHLVQFQLACVNEVKSSQNQVKKESNMDWGKECVQKLC